MSLRTAGRGAFVFIFVAVLVDSIGFGIILPALPRLIMQLTGVSVDRAAVYGGRLHLGPAAPALLPPPVHRNLDPPFLVPAVGAVALLGPGCDYLRLGVSPLV